MNDVFKCRSGMLLLALVAFVLLAGGLAKLAWAHDEPALASNPPLDQYEAEKGYSQDSALGVESGGVGAVNKADPTVSADAARAASPNGSPASAPASASASASAVPPASADARLEEPDTQLADAGNSAEAHDPSIDGSSSGDIDEDTPDGVSSSDDEADEETIPGYPYDGEPCADTDCGVVGVDPGYECAVFETARGERVVGCYKRLYGNVNHGIEWYADGEQYHYDIVGPYHKGPYYPPPTPPSKCKGTCGATDVPEGWHCYRYSPEDHLPYSTYCKRPGYVLGEDSNFSGSCVIFYDAQGRPRSARPCNGRTGGASGQQAGRDSQVADRGLEESSKRQTGDPTETSAAGRQDGPTDIGRIAIWTVLQEALLAGGSGQTGDPDETFATGRQDDPTSVDRIAIWTVLQEALMAGGPTFDGEQDDASGDDPALLMLTRRASPDNGSGESIGANAARGASGSGGAGKPQRGLVALRSEATHEVPTSVVSGASGQEDIRAKAPVPGDAGGSKTEISGDGTETRSRVGLSIPVVENDLAAARNGSDGEVASNTRDEDVSSNGSKGAEDANGVAGFASRASKPHDRAGGRAFWVLGGAALIAGMLVLVRHRTARTPPG